MDNLFNQKETNFFSKEENQEKTDKKQNIEKEKQLEANLIQLDNLDDLEKRIKQLERQLEKQGDQNINSLFFLNSEIKQIKQTEIKQIKEEIKECKEITSFLQTEYQKLKQEQIEKQKIQENLTFAEKIRAYPFNRNYGTDGLDTSTNIITVRVPSQIHQQFFDFCHNEKISSRKVMIYLVENFINSSLLEEKNNKI